MVGLNFDIHLVAHAVIYFISSLLSLIVAVPSALVSVSILRPTVKVGHQHCHKKGCLVKMKFITHCASINGFSKAPNNSLSYLNHYIITFMNS